MSLTINRKSLKDTKKRTIPYIGIAKYCYANSASMLLASIGENISLSRIEVLTGVGLGAEIEKKKNLIFFNNLILLPDLGISKALKILGFSCIEKVSQKLWPAPFKELKKDLEKSPAVLGPLDMGHLNYNPRHKYLGGADHFILVYGIDDKEVYIHDPAGFPYVSLPLEQLKLAWKAERIFYRHGFYRYITCPRRVENPTEEEIYNRALQFFKSIYHESKKKATRQNRIFGHEAILTYANRMRDGKVSQEEVDHLIYFALSLGAKRSLDFASFFDFRDAGLAALKRTQAQLFGKCHVFAVRKALPRLAKTFEQLAEVEEEFHVTLLAT